MRRRVRTLSSASLIVPVLAAAGLLAAPAGAHAQVSAVRANAATALPTAASPAGSWTFTGSGWGHGVGMSQYGAYGQALAGRSAAQILQHYFTGAGVSTVADAVDLRVNLLHRATTFKVASVALASGGGAATVSVPSAGSLAFVPGDVVTFGLSGSSVTVSRSGPSGAGSLTGASASVTWAGTRAMAGVATLLDVAGSGESLGDTAGRYRWGTLDVRPVSASGVVRLEAVNVVRLHDDYLKGIAEMPSSWAPAALQAQVIAARSYAITKHAAGVRADCSCHVYDTSSDQVFAGWAKEGEPTYGAKWVAAVVATAPSGTTGQVLTYGGKVVQAYYSSSSGGRTQNNEDVWSGSAIPYLRSVDDPWSLDPRNPRANWEKTVSAADLAAAFGLPDVVRLDLSRRTAGGAVAVAYAWSSGGASASLSGNTMRSKLGLNSAYVRRTATRLSGPDRYATAASVAATVHPGANTVVIVNGLDAHLVDGLVAGPLSAAAQAPILLSDATSLPAATVAELNRRGAAVTHAYVLGSEGAVPASVVAALEARGLTVTRLGGADRYETAASVAREVRARVGAYRPAVVLASGRQANLVDALSASGPAAAELRPILLTDLDALPAASAAALTDVGAEHVLVVGSAAVVAESVRADLTALGLGSTRAGGADRYATAAAVANAVKPYLDHPEQVVVSVGAPANLVDAIAAGSLQRALLLVTPTAVPAPTRAYLQSEGIVSTVSVVGSPLILPAAVVTALTTA